MNHELGISVYPDIRPLSEIREYFALASKYGVTRVFSSMFSVEGTKEEVLSYFRDLISAAHEYGMRVSLDVNPDCFSRMGATIEDLSVFRGIGVDILRMDMSYGGEKDRILTENKEGIQIEFNAFPSLVKDVVDAGADPKKVIVCHNFYPQRYTALKWNRFLDNNRQIKAVSKDVRIAAFISSNAPDTHGVWGAICGLPTVEMMRDMPIDLQARLLLGTGTVDDLLIGNAYATEEEFASLQQVLNSLDMPEKAGADNPIVKAILGNWVSATPQIKCVRVTLDDDVTETEKEALFDFFPHLDLGDSSEWIWRSRISRFKYSDPKEVIAPRHYDQKMFEVGDVMIVNDNYKHYAGEIQIVKEPIINDGLRNRVGHLTPDEYHMMDVINDGDIVRFIH